MTANPLSVRLASGYTEKTRNALLPETSTLLAPVELVINNVPAVSSLSMIISMPVNVMVLAMGSAKPMVSWSLVAFALEIAPRKLQS